MPLPLVTWCERDAINQERSPGPLLEFSFHNHIKVRNRFCPGRIVHQGVTDTDTLMAGHWHAAPGLWSHPCHGSSDLGKVRSVDTWHSPGVLWLVSVLSSRSLIGWWRSSLINTLLSITNTHSCHPQLSLNIDTRFTFPGSWNSSILLHVMFVASCDRMSWTEKLEFLAWAPFNANVVIAIQSNVVINFNDSADANLWPCDSDKNLFRNVLKLFKICEK